MVLMENAGVVLEVFIYPQHPVRVSNPEALGLRHVAFTVDDLGEMVEKMNCEPIRTDWFGRRFTFIKDPDGLPIEIKEK